LLDTAKGYETHLKAGGKMLVTLAGAMSTAELGISLAETIRKDKVHAIVLHRRESRGGCFQSRRARLLRARPALSSPHRRGRSEAVERHMNRVTNTCIPEMEAMRRIEAVVADELDQGRPSRRALFPARVHV